MKKDISTYEYALENTLDSRDSNWYKAISEKDFQTALSILESKNEHTSTEKLWWVRAQLSLRQLPASTLVTPLEQVYENLDSNSKALASSTYIKTSKALIKSKQSRLAVLTSKRAHALIEDNQIALVYKESLELEINNAKAGKQSSSYIDELEQELNKLNLNNSETSNNESVSNKTSEEASSKIPDNSGWTNSSSEEESSTEIESDIKAGTTRSSKKRFPLGYILTGLLFMLLGLSFNFIFTKEEKHLTNLDYNIKVPDPATPRLEISEEKIIEEIKLQNSDNNKLDNTLDNVKERISSIGTQEELDQQEIDSNDRDISDQDISDEDLTETEEQNSNSIQESFTEDYSKQIDLEPIPPGKIPDISTEKRSTPELIEQTPRRVEPSLPKASKGVRTYDVKVFEPPLKYKTITSTEVLSAPSLLSNSLARLNNDTHVLVTRKMGLWLEIRSSQGNIGYIYAQDASEL